MEPQLCWGLSSQLHIALTYQTPQLLHKPLGKIVSSLVNPQSKLSDSESLEWTGISRPKQPQPHWTWTGTSISITNLDRQDLQRKQTELKRWEASQSVFPLRAGFRRPQPRPVLYSLRQEAVRGPGLPRDCREGNEIAVKVRFRDQNKRKHQILPDTILTQHTNIQGGSQQFPRWLRMAQVHFCVAFPFCEEATFLQVLLSWL